MIESKTPLAISTSGDYERYVVVDGKRYGHIMDPKSGIPADYYDSVTVVTLDPIQSDVLSTALFAMPPDEAYKFAEEKNIAALFLDKNGKVTVTPRGKLYFSKIKK
jgi:thiamine biosynthesis lipoprotein